MHLLFTSETLPTPTENVPTIIQVISLEDQGHQSERLYIFLTEESPDVTKLNEDIILRTILFSVPCSQMVKLVYCGDIMGSIPIGTTSDIDGHYFFLTGDSRNKLGSLLLVVIPTPMHTEAKLLTMTHNQFLTACH